MELMEPIVFERTGEAAASDGAYVEHCHRRVHGEMEARLARLAAERRATRFGRAVPATEPLFVARAPEQAARPSARAPALVDVAAPPA